MGNGCSTQHGAALTKSPVEVSRVLEGRTNRVSDELGEGLLCTLAGLDLHALGAATVSSLLS